MVDDLKLGEVQQKIYEVLGNNGMMCATDIGVMLGRTRDGINGNLQRMRRMGLIRVARKVTNPNSEFNHLTNLWEIGRCAMLGAVERHIKHKPERIKRLGSGQIGRPYIPEFKPLRRDPFEHMHRCEESRWK